MIEELDLVSQVVQWRADDERWRIVSKDELEAEAAGEIERNDSDWASIDPDAHWRIHRGLHHLVGQVIGGLPSKVKVNDGMALEVHVVGGLWAARSEIAIVKSDVTYSDGDPAGSHFSELTLNVDPTRPIEPWPPDQSTWLDATVANLPDTPLGRLMRPVIADLEATMPGLLRFGDVPSRDAEPGMIYVRDSSCAGRGLHPMWAEDEPYGDLQIPDTVQEAAIEALWREEQSAVWPVCPDHPICGGVRRQIGWSRRSAN